MGEYREEATLTAEGGGVRLEQQGQQAPAGVDSRQTAPRGILQVVSRQRWRTSNKTQATG